MSIKINECQVVDYYLEIETKYAGDTKKVDKCLIEILGSHGVTVQNFKSNSYKTLRLRFTRILSKIRDNKKASKDKHNKFDSDKLFFCQKDFPNLSDCANETTD